MWQLLVDFKRLKMTMFIERASKAVYEFEFSNKLISLTKLCMHGTKYQLRINHILSEEFQIVKGLKQENALSPLMFKLN